MSIDPIFDTNVLVHVVRNLKLPSQFLLQTFFPNVVEFETEYVSIDVDVGLRRMSPFVSPLVEGKPVEGRKIQTNTFRPAYIKDLRTPDFRKPVLRAIGERIGGNLSAAVRIQQNLAFEMEDQVQMVQRRLEWMAAQALIGGTVTIVGEGFPSVLVDFGRDAALTVALSGGTLWSPATILAGTATPAANIEQWGHIMLKKSGGVATDIIFTTTAWNNFMLDPVVKTTIWYPGSGGNGNTINVGAQIQRGAQYKGRWGQYDLWVYNDWYVDANNVEQPMIPDGSLIMSGADLLGTRAFGQIMDPAFNYASLPYAPKTWVENDPPQRLIMMQSSPIVIPSRVNAAFAATVSTAVVN